MTARRTTTISGVEYEIELAVPNRLSVFYPGDDQTRCDLEATTGGFRLWVVVNHSAHDCGFGSSSLDEALEKAAAAMRSKLDNLHADTAARAERETAARYTDALADLWDSADPA